MAEPYIGQIHIFPYNFAPRGYAFCWGQILPIQQNTALFSIIGTFYGGNGQNTFALPDFRGRGALSQGQLSGGQLYVVGEQSGETQITLLSTEMPSHSHAPSGAVITGSLPVNAPGPSSMFTNTSPNNLYGLNLTPTTPLAPQTIGVSGGNQPHANQQPYLGLYYCIALEGVFPTRN